MVFVAVALFLLACYLGFKLLAVKAKEREVLEILGEIQKGNLKRRLLAREGDLGAEICYKINEIVGHYEGELSQLAAKEQNHKQMMTCLSHDVRTPLTTLLGYLEAVLSGAVLDGEKEAYLQTAQSKAYALKDYVDDLFEWFKVNSSEQSYQFEVVDINELSREIVSDWIVRFEEQGLDYAIDIGEGELLASLDAGAYPRILNNLIQNALSHSGGSKIGVGVVGFDQKIEVKVTDNGHGVSAGELPHIFERLYRGDRSRPIGSSGLGLSIVADLVKAHGGTISADSVEGEGTVFCLILDRKTAKPVSDL